MADPGGNPRWPFGALNAEALRASAWRPTPLQEFVLKVHQRCNLACDYCHVYAMADRSWRDRPAVMPVKVWTVAARRIAEHVNTHRLPAVSVVLHGGEPVGLDNSVSPCELVLRPDP